MIITDRELKMFFTKNKDKILAGSQYLSEVISYYPIPSDTDYTNGQMDRYFVKRYDSNPIEVSKKFYNTKFSKLSKGLYFRGTLKWFLSDTSNLVAPYTIGTTSAKDRNISEIHRLNVQLPGLKLHLNNPLQFNASDVDVRIGRIGGESLAPGRIPRR